ncbi:MAG: ATP-grasp domain-containing protein [Candidatus Bathyarchaeia archaeon]
MKRASRAELTVLVIAFNARPIALSAKRLGFRVLAADYWGDVDIQGRVDGLASVIVQRPGTRPTRPKESVAESLLRVASKLIADHGKPDIVLLGSGLDDRPDIWSRISRMAPILGNGAESLPRLRDRMRLFDLAEELNIRCPVTVETRDVEECVEGAREIGFPIVLKPPAGSGGYYIELAKDEEQIRALYGERRKMLLQEYVKGTDVSASVLGNGEECFVVTVNEQLIGRGDLGMTRPFGYCGNVVPLSVSRDIVAEIEEASKTLGEALTLVGTNGIDWVVDRNGTPVLMEINPRFQATLECIEKVSGKNLVDLHLDACNGRLPDRLNPVGFATKMILYATHRGVVGNLSKVEGICDVTRPGVIVEKEDPICTVQKWEKTRIRSVYSAKRTVRRVRNLIHGA